MLIGLLVCWEWAVRLGAVSPLLAPAPTAILRDLGRLLSEGILLPHLAASLLRLGVGLVAGGAMGVALGLVMGWSPPVRRSLDPLVAAFHPVPKIALFPLLIVLLGIGEYSKIAAVAIGAFFPTLINTTLGVRSISSVQLDLARSYGAGTLAIFRRVLVPGSLPMILTGLRIAANVAFLSTIGVEMVAASTGLGSLLWLSWQLFMVEQLYATLVVVMVVGVVLSWMIRALARQTAPWLSERESAL